VILELREGDDGVQVETARMMVCGDRSFASCRHVERRLEIRAVVVLCRGRRRMTSMGRSGRRRSYQGVQDDEAGLMAKQVGRGCSGLPAIPRWRSCCG
jgi:hypothetical protein